MTTIEIQDDGLFHVHCDSWQDRLRFIAYMGRIELEHLQAEADITKFILKENKQ
jgi:hypothetical protein